MSTSNKSLSTKQVKSFLTNNALYIILIAIFVGVIIAEPRFLTISNFTNILKQASTKGMLALGCAGIIVLAGTDLSIGRILGLSAAVSASLLQSVTYASRYYPQITEPLPLILPLLISIAIAVAFTALNAFGVAKLHMHAFIITLGTQMIAYGVNCIYIENQASGSAQALSTLDRRFVNVANGSFNVFGIDIPYLIVYFLLSAVVVYFIWNYTRLGKNMFAVGGNQAAAEVSGVNVTKTIFGVYLVAGVLYGIGAFLEAARVQSVSSATGLNYELDAISACVIGGVSFSGGVGTVPGVVLGMVVLQALNYCLYYLGINAYLQYIFKGLIIILAVALDVRKHLERK